MTDGIDQEGRAAFLRSLPRKVAELRATLGTIVADPKSQRMRDEMRRRLHAIYTLARSYSLPTLSEGLRDGIAHLDALKGASVLTQRDIETLTDLIATLPALAQRDSPDPFIERGRPGAAPAAPPAPRGPTAPTMRAPAPLGGRVVPPLNERITALPPVPPRPVAAERAPATPPRPVAPAAPAAEATGSAAAAPLGVLVVGGAELLAEARQALGAEAEVTGVRTLTEGVTAARDMAPDVVLAQSRPPADGLGMLAALRGDPLTDFIPVLLIAGRDDGVDAETARAQGAAELLAAPVEAAALRAAIERAAQGVSQAAATPPAFGEVTLEELTQTLQEEIRRGILGAAGPRSGSARVSLGQGSEVLAATWEAIARVREVVEKKTRGRVRFELPSAPLGLAGAHVLSIGDDDEPPPEDLAATDDPLPGRAALVVDDDPAVVSFFAGLLRDAEMTVTECTDGRQALREARRVRPDLVISDILMPGLDGFALCRQIRRDVSLRHTPVILLSWKEDLLVRMRDLGAQAQGFLRKESRGDAILARVRAVLRPRVRMLRRLEALGPGAELRGRVERVGVFTLLEATARALGDATLTVTDSFSVTELDVRAGRLLSAVRTAQDGSLSRGEPALLMVLGASSARFAVRRATHNVRANVPGELGALLARCAARVSALEDAVSGAALLEVATLDVDSDSALNYARSLPAPMRAMVERVVQGASPRDLVLRDGVAPQDLEPLLVELARRGAIRGVRGLDGEDLAAQRLAAAEAADRAPPPPSSALRPAPVPADVAPAAPHAAPGPGGPALSAAAQTQPDAPVGSATPSERAAEPVLSWTPPMNADEAARPGFGLEAEADTLAGAVLRELSEPPPGAAVEPEDGDAREAEPEAAPPEIASPEARSDAPVAAPSAATTTVIAEPPPPPAPTSTEPVREAPTPATAPSGQTRAPAAADAPGGAPAASEPPDAARDPGAARDEVTAPDDSAAAAPPQEVELDARGLPRRRSVADLPDIEGALFEPHEPVRREPDTAPSALVIVDPELVGAPVEVRDTPGDEPVARPTRRAPRPKQPAAPTAAPHKEPGDGRRSVVWFLVGVLALGAVSFLSVRYYLRARYGPPVPTRTDGPAVVVAPDDAAVADAVAVAAGDDAAPSAAARGEDQDAGAPPPEDAAVAPSVADGASGAAALYRDPGPYLDGGALAEAQGLLVIETPGREGVEITVDGRVVGPAPLVLPLGEGLHQIDYPAGGGITGHRLATVAAGRALPIALPAEP